jgi:hypothetical protein
LVNTGAHAQESPQKMAVAIASTAGWCLWSLWTKSKPERNLLP